MASGKKIERFVVTAVSSLELIPKAELPLVLQLQADNGLSQRAPVLAYDTQRGTFQKPEPLEEVSADKGVAEVQQEPTEEHPFTVDVDRVWA